MENIIIYIIYPILVTIITMFIKDKIEQGNKLKKEFYMKFYDLYLRIYRGRAYAFSDLTEDEQEKFIDLIIENEKYTYGILNELFYSFIVSIPYKEENKKIENETNKIFNEIVDIVTDKIRKRKNKISIWERWKYNKIIKNRNTEDNQIFYISSVDKEGILHITEDKDC